MYIYVYVFVCMYKLDKCVHPSRYKDARKDEDVAGLRKIKLGAKDDASSDTQYCGHGVEHTDTDKLCTG